MSRFRIRENDTVSATACNTEGKLKSSLFDSGFTTIEQVKNALLRKLPLYGGKKLIISITNLDKETYKDFTIRVN